MSISKDLRDRSVYVPFGSYQPQSLLPYSHPSTPTSNGTSSVPCCSPCIRNSFISRCTFVRPFITRSFLCLIFLFIFSILLVFISTNNKCNMTANLAPLLLYTASTFAANQIPFFLDYGTLLGAVREGGIIDFDFDIDLGLMESECKRVSELRHLFKQEKGYHVYDQHDYIAVKENLVLGYDGYLHSPCIRIYDAEQLYYIDVYWYRHVTPIQVMEMREKKQHINTEWTPDQEQRVQDSLISSTGTGTSTSEEFDLVCNDDAYETLTPGGCRPYAGTFPLATIPFLEASLPVPASPSAHLNAIYGTGWMIPQGKGYKRVCGLLPGPGVSKRIVLVLAFLLCIFGAREWRQNRKMSETEKRKREDGTGFINGETGETHGPSAYVPIDEEGKGPNRSALDTA